MGEYDLEEIYNLADLLEDLLEDVSSKVRGDLQRVIGALKSANNSGDLLKIQDELESVLNNLPNSESYARSEIMNVITDIENIVNS